METVMERLTRAFDQLLAVQNAGPPTIARAKALAHIFDALQLLGQETTKCHSQSVPEEARPDLIVIEPAPEGMNMIAMHITTRGGQTIRVLLDPLDVEEMAYDIGSALKEIGRSL